MKKRTKTTDSNAVGQPPVGADPAAPEPMAPTPSSRPCPRSNGKCSMDCPLHDFDHMPGWPVFEVCYAWDDDLDGKEPYYLDDAAICKPALRLQSENNKAEP